MSVQALTELPTASLPGIADLDLGLGFAHASVGKSNVASSRTEPPDSRTQDQFPALLQPVQQYLAASVPSAVRSTFPT